MYNIRSAGLYTYYYSPIHPSYLDPCDQPIYPPGFISNMTHCNVLVLQWTYNKTAGQCVEFYYYACGEDRKGYNVFASEQECTKTCVHIGNANNNVLYCPFMFT